MLIENILIFALIAYLTYTTKRRNYIGLVVLGYYAIFIFIDTEFYGILFDRIPIHTDWQAWYVFTIVSYLSFALLSTYLFYKGCNVCGIYAAWLILGATVTALVLINQASVNWLNSVYNILQSMNLFVDLIVVIIGTDNILTRTKHIGSAINTINNWIDNCFNSYTHNRRKG